MRKCIMMIDDEVLRSLFGLVPMFQCYMRNMFKVHVFNDVSSVLPLFFEGVGVCGKPICYREQIRKSCGNMGT